jgi:hypothetical protein
MLPVLDNEPKLRMMLGDRQGLRADTTSDIDNQRALRKEFPAVPCKFNISKVRWSCAINVARRDRTVQDGIDR